jgi:serine phosphatase RsbU (regulator of sigma subunit)
LPRARAPKTPLRQLVDIVWKAPVWAVPFALFFGTVYGGNRDAYIGAYLVSLVMAYVISAFTWLAEHVLVPQLRRSAPDVVGRVPFAEALVYVVASIAGAYAGGLIIRLTFMPTFFGSWREVLTFGMYTGLFAVSFSAIAYALYFYRQSIDRARSDQELTLARRIQRSFLLSQFPEMPRLDVHAVNISSKQVSGDFYDVVPAGDDSLLLAVADVSGKGFPAALLTSMLQASLRTQATTVPSVATILSNVNQLVYRNTLAQQQSPDAGSQQFATFFLARVDERTLRLHYSNAGHNFPIVYRTSGERVMLERGGTVIGILERAEFEEGAMDLRPGDRVLLYTDGISEAALESGEMFGEDRIHAAIESLPASLTAREIIEGLLERVRGFLDGVEAGDDMTVMVLRVLEDAAPPPRG